MTDSPPRLSLLVKTLHQAIRSKADAALRGRGLSMARIGVLTLLDSRPGASNAELARAALISPQSMGEIVRTLEEQGLIIRSVDPLNARVLRTVLTDEGAEALATADAAIAGIEARLSAGLSAGEDLALRSSLERCAAVLLERKPSGGPETT